jgi:hypothetical protein
MKKNLKKELKESFKEAWNKICLVRIIKWINKKLNF